MKIAGIQHDIAWCDRDANFARLAPQVAAAAASGAGLVLLSETFSTGFGFAEPGFQPEPEGGPSSRFLADQAAEHGVWVGGTCPEVYPGHDKPSNSFVLAGPDGTQHRYRKIHPFSHAGEERYVQPGTELVTVDVDGLRVSLFVCYDLRFADEFWALAHDTDAYLVVANWPEKRRLHWSTLLRARAIENQAYVVGVNRVGSGGKLDYSGDSRIVDPFGELLATSLQARGVRGLVIDAGIRDTVDLRAIGFPVWSQHVSCQGTVKSSPGSVNVPVVLGGVIVHPGDVVCADDDGVVIVPREHAVWALEQSQQRIAKEATTRARLAAGELGIDFYGLRAKLAEMGVEYVDRL